MHPLATPKLSMRYVMGKVVREAVFFTIATVIILPTPTLVFAYMTGKTVLEVLYR